MSNSETDQTAIACDLSVFSTEEREHHFAVVESLFAAVRKARELPDGYAFRLPEDSSWLFTLAEFIRDERKCCPFWAFGVRVEPHGGAIWLDLMGPEGVKPLLAADLVRYLNPQVSASIGLSEAV